MNRNCLKTGIQKMHCAHIDHFKDAWPAWHEPEQFTTSYQQCSEVRMFEKDPKIGPFWFPHIPRPVYGSFFVRQSTGTLSWSRQRFWLTLSPDLGLAPDLVTQSHPYQQSSGSVQAYLLLDQLRTSLGPYGSRQIMTHDLLTTGSTCIFVSHF